MNRVIWVMAAILAVVVFLESFFLLLSRPEKVGLVPGSVRLTHGHLDGDRVVVIDGEDADYLWQIQGIGVDFKGSRIYIQMYGILLHPFSRLTTHSDWPVVLREKGLSPGPYEVFYWAGNRGYLSAGKFTVLPTPAGPTASIHRGTER